MPEDPNIIFKLQLDSSGFIINKPTADLQKFIDAQRVANQTLLDSQKTLSDTAGRVRDLTAQLEKAKANNASNVPFLTTQLASSQSALDHLTKTVEDNQKAVQAANTAAQDYLTTLQKAQALPAIPAPGNTLQPNQLDLFNPPPVPPTPPPGTQFDLQFPTQLPEEISNTTAEMEKLAAALELVKNEMEGLDPKSEKFQELNGILQAGNAVLAEYKTQLKDTGSAVNEAEQKHVTYITRIRVLREELLRLSEAGKENTKEFRDTSVEAAKLSREYRVLQERIRVLSSENRALDFGKAAIRGAIGGFETLVSTSVLFGEKNEELEKKTLKLFAAMQLLNGIEELTNLARKSGTVVIELQTAATAVYSSVVGAATGATKALRIALLSTGIGAIVAGLGFLVLKFIQLKEAEEKANEEAKLTAEINDKAIDSYAGQVAQLEILKRQLNDFNTPLEKRIELAREYNKTADEGNKIDLISIQQADQNKTATQQLTAAIDAQIKSIEAKALAEAASNINTQKATDFFKAQAKLLSELQTDRFKVAFPKFELDVPNIDKQIAEVTTKLSKDLRESTIVNGQFVANEDESLLSMLNHIKETNSALELSSSLTQKLRGNVQLVTIDPNSVQAQRERLTKAIADNEKLFSESSGKNEAFRNNLIAENKIFQKQLDDLTLKEVKSAGTVENLFIQERDALNKQLADLQANTTVTIEEISKRFDERLTQQKDKLAQEVKKKQITSEQSQILLEIFVKVNDESRKQEIEKFTKEQIDAQKQIQDQIVSLQQKAEVDTINNIREEFTRRATLIEANERIELETRQRGEDAQIKALQEKRDAGLLNEQQYQDDKNAIIEAGEQEATSITIKFARQREELSLAVFKNTLDQIQETFRENNLKIQQNTALFVRNTADRFLSGNINFRTFKKQTDDFISDQNATSRKNQITANNEEIIRTSLKLDTIRDRTSKSYTDLFERRKKLQEDTAKLVTADAEAQAEDKQKKTQERIDAIQGYADAIGNVATSVIGFWQAANAAEAQALDRSIALQQRRVDEAIRIADKGNATYLKAEADRLKQLEVQRENAARRQLGVDAALQASQILVGITGAIAKISTGIGAAETIAEIAIIVGALATGYGLVKQLQANQPKLKEGTPYVSRGANKPGVDTVPAWLSEGEAVIPAERNRKYSTAVKAIYDERIPADVLNEFVSKYSTKPPKTIVEKVLKGETVTSEFINSVDKKDFDEKSKLVYAIQNLTKRFIGQEHDKSFIQSLKAEEVKSYSQIIEKALNQHTAENRSVKDLDVNNIVYKVLNKSQNVKTYEKFVSGITKAPGKKINEFINTYERTAVEKLVRETAKEKVKDVTKRDTLLKDVDHSNFVNTFHTIKHVPLPNYEHISEVHEMKMGQDGKLRSVLEEQNSLLKENNEHQKETQRLLKSMGVSVKIDQDGVSAMVMKAIEQKKIYSKI